jgi:hypothetical protein
MWIDESKIELEVLSNQKNPWIGIKDSFKFLKKLEPRLNVLLKKLEMLVNTFIKILGKRMVCYIKMDITNIVLSSNKI